MLAMLAVLAMLPPVSAVIIFETRRAPVDIRQPLVLASGTKTSLWLAI